LYSDELDFCVAAHREGYKTVVARNAIACHRVEVRQQASDSSVYFFYYFTRNSVILARTLLPFGQRLLFHLIYPPLCARRIIKRLFARQPHLARALFCGFLDGYRGVTGKWKDHDRDARRGGGG
jgi:GT2 family glycosyltransferase